MKRHWFLEFFGRDYPWLYADRLDSKNTVNEIDFFEQIFPLEPGSVILDLCCGEGRHSIELSKRGYKVTGQDLSAEYIENAKNESERLGLKINFIKEDMTKIEGRHIYDIVINMFTSFGYLAEDRLNSQVLEQIHKALKPNGYLLIDTLNHEWVMANQVDLEESFLSDGTRVIEHREFDFLEGRNHIWFEEEEPGYSKRKIEGHHIRLYTLVELINLLKECSLEFLNVYGGFDGEIYSQKSQRMIVVAKNTVVESAK